MYSVILCGGAGTRLWPLSRKSYSKQFLSLYSENSLIQETFFRMKGLMPTSHIFVVTGKDGYFDVLRQLQEVDEHFDAKQILVEPVALNTAPAITYAIKHLVEMVKVPLTTPIMIAPSDHYIADSGAYTKIVKDFALTVGPHIGTIGITPTKPETGYGYIKKGDLIKPYHAVTEFKEKPSQEIAKSYVDSGKYVWNSGMYLFAIETFIEELKKHAPGIHEHFKKDMKTFLSDFSLMPSISIDYAISEKSDKVVVYEGDFGWNDIGSFDSLADLQDKKEDTRHINIDSHNIFIHNGNDKVIATIGVDDLNIIDTKDGLLIKKRGTGEDVKKVVEKMKELKMKEVDHNMLGYRPWGKYEVLVDQPNHKVKKIVVYPGGRLSLQSHGKRSEHWIIVKGIAGVTHGESYKIFSENESVHIPVNTKHRLENKGEGLLEVIEVQTGDYFGEDDIVRFDDEYGRVGA
jgi:mannose-1-phosphate guanylyltransferase/mannose-6-phosphate isomerase